MKIGATNEFPRGKVAKDDEGELNIGIIGDFKHNVVGLYFGKPITWLAFEADDGEKFIELIKQKITELRAVNNAE